MEAVFRCVTPRLGRRVALVSGLWLLAACSHGSTRVPPTTIDGETGSASIRSSRYRRSCKSDSQCPSGQRCGFTGRTSCEGSGTCIIEKAGASCADPGGRCGCDGQPVDVFCAVGASSEFTSAPAPFVGPCPIPCTARNRANPWLRQSGDSAYDPANGPTGDFIARNPPRFARSSSPIDLPYLYTEHFSPIIGQNIAVYVFSTLRD